MSPGLRNPGKVIILLTLHIISNDALNKYSKDANVEFGKSNILYEPEVNIRTLERPFRMAKLNLLWTKAQVVSFTQPISMRCFLNVPTTHNNLF